MSAGKLTDLAGAPRGLHLPDVQPDPGPDGLSERRAAAAPHQAVQGRAPEARRDRAARSSASPTACTTIPGSSPAARSSGWPSPGPSSPTRRSCSATSPPATSTARAPTRSWSIIDRLVTEYGKTVLMVTHDPRAAERARAVLHLGQGGPGRGGRSRGPGMKFFRLLWANLRRKKVRTTLTIGSFLVALFLFGAPGGRPHRAFGGGVDVAGADRLIVINRVSLILPLPFSYRDRLLRLPGVKAVTHATWFGGVYQDERNFFPQFAVETEDTWLDVYPELRARREGQWKRSWRDRQACVVGRSLADRFGFKVGDRIPLKGTHLAGDLGVQRAPASTRARRPDADDERPVVVSAHDYLRGARRAFGKGTVGWYVVQLGDPDDGAAVAKAIDELFANSPFETLTQTEKAFAASFVKQMGNIELLIMSIGGGRVLHASPRHRQHHGHRRPRAVRRAGRAEDGRLLRPPRPRAHPRRSRC
ncbi:MAG: hypothetical protein MZU84_08950 [Sphingobacterium sp.]|nr:hypothetical protein [Sphingobacterium sp.]